MNQYQVLNDRREEQNIEEDMKIIANVTKGRINPKTGFLIWVGNDAKPFYKFHDIIDYVNEQGLRRLS